MIGDALTIYRRMLEMKMQPTVQTFGYLASGYSSLEMYCDITILWGDTKRNMETGILMFSRDLSLYTIELSSRCEDVEIQMEDRKYVRIIAEKKERREDKGKSSYVMESSSSGYYHRFCLPENANVNQINASIENNGVVTIVVPKN
ncbi:hypothetical protein Q3G72_006161 [Acer saccharum]|nr:hypothetical protein Q3G72_006161 [Acer saccharum]